MKKKRISKKKSLNGLKAINAELGKIFRRSLGTVPIERLKARPSHRKGKTKYAGLYKKINGLKPGKAIALPTPRGMKSGILLNQITAAIVNGTKLGHLMPPPKGFRYRRRSLINGKVSVECVRKTA